MRLCLPFGCCCLMVLSGCFKSTLVTFPPTRQVEAIEVSDANSPGEPPLFTIENPKRIDEILAFLRTKAGAWDSVKSVPSAGDYRLTFIGDEIRLFVRTGDGILQVQGADYECRYRDLTPADQEAFLALILDSETPR